jgi:hypothetical protein
MAPTESAVRWFRQDPGVLDGDQVLSEYDSRLERYRRLRRCLVAGCDGTGACVVDSSGATGLGVKLG